MKYRRRCAGRVFKPLLAAKGVIQLSERKRKGHRNGQVIYREMTARESLDEVSKHTSWRKSSHAEGIETKHIGQPDLLDMSPSVFDDMTL